MEISIEEKKAIEQVKKLLENASPFTMSPYIYFSLEKVLNLIKKQEFKINGLEGDIEGLKLSNKDRDKTIEKQDEMINLMAGRIVELLEEKNITNHSKKDVIDTFKNLTVNNLLKEDK